MDKAHAKISSWLSIKKCKKRGGWVKVKHSANKKSKLIIHLIKLKISEDLGLRIK